MMSLTLLIIAGLSVFAFYTSRSRAISLSGTHLSNLHSRPVYHGFYGALLTFLTGLIVAFSLAIASNWYIDHSLTTTMPAEIAAQSPLMQERILTDAKTLANGGIVGKASSEKINKARQQLATNYTKLASLKAWLLPLIVTAFAFLAFVVAYFRIKPAFRSRNRAETIVRYILMISASLAIITTFGILFSLIGETVKFFQEVSILKFLFGTHWSPLSGVFGGKVDENTVGVIPLFLGTAMITLIALFVAVPVGLFSAIYLSEFASPMLRASAKPMLEILAGIPTVVYGFFAALTVAPFIRNVGESVGLAVSAQSALAAGLVMGIMIIPFISSLSDDVINAVPQSLRDGSYGLGATKAETVMRVVLPAALPGIVSAVVLAMSRAVGETMIVVMAAGHGANLTFNPLEAVTTVTVQIVALINGDTDASTAAGPAFSLGFTLFFITMALNLIALRIVKKYSEKYD